MVLKNMSLKSLLVMLFVAGFSAPSSAVVAGEYQANFEKVRAVEDRPPRAGQWRKPPAVIICELAPIQRYQIGSALQFWEQLGYSFGPLRYKQDPLDKCKDPTPDGHIIIHLISRDTKIDATSLAQTHFYVNNSTSEIEWAIIYFRSDVRAQVLEHELGHALGFLHYNKLDHLMHSKWPLGGWKTTGLESSHR